MRLEYKYGEVFWTDLHPGDMIPTAAGDYITISEKDIDENGNLIKTNIMLSSSLNEVVDYDNRRNPK